MPAQIIKMQSYRDYQNGLITKEELVEGKTFFKDSPRAERLRNFNAFDIFAMGERGRDKDGNFPNKEE